jgi:hypothetical protein
MLEFLQRDLQPKSETFGQLTIERRVLITPKSTINIASIAVISSGTASVPNKAAWNLALIFLVAGAVVLAVGIGQNAHLAIAAGGIGIFSGIILARFFAKAEKPCLSITSTDGHKHQFIGQRRTLEEVRRILSDKINALDESTVYRVSFEKGIIQPMNVPHVEAVGAMLGGAASGEVMPRVPDTRGGALETYAPAAAPPAHSQVGHSDHAGRPPHVDYSQVLAQIVDMQRFYAQRQDTQDIAERLNELEYLMRSGTPTPATRGRLNHLLGELSSILGAYPDVVQIFHRAARLAGY